MRNCSENNTWSCAFSFVKLFFSFHAYPCAAHCLSDVLFNHVHNPRSGLIFEWRWNFNFNAVSSVCFANFLCPRQGRIVHRFRSTLLHNFPLRFEVMRILGIKIESSLHSVTLEHIRIVQLRQKFKLTSEHNLDNFWSSGSFQIFAGNFAIGFPVALHWLALLQEEVE